MCCSLVRRGVLILALAAALPTPATAITGPATIKITDAQRAYTRIDGGPPGTGVADLELIDLVLYNARVTKRAIGRGRLACTFLDVRSRNCSGTFFLPRGELVVGGVIGSRLLFALPVIGGTGLYANARGTLTVTSLGLRPRRELLLFRLVT